jgi:hypothetical protein
MDSVKYIVAKKNKELMDSKLNSKLEGKKKAKYVNGPHYYGIWSLSGFMIGQQKLRGS